MRHHVVFNALSWLCNNHTHYQHVKISKANLNEYKENDTPVDIIYQHSLSNKVPEGTSVFDMTDADGTDNGICPIAVHSIVGEQLPMTDIRTQKSIATRHFKNDNGVLAIGHAEHPESIYNNTTLYLSMFPWLFPYGFGGVGLTHLSDTAHQKWLMMYHDKRFQTDVGFPFVAFSHEQIKASTTAGYLLVKKDKFHHIADRILRLDENVLDSLSAHLSSGESVKPVTPAEKDCFQLFNDLDHVSYKVQGSLTSKKYMHNEVYSLMAAEGAPSWYITFAPSDHKHPILLYWADKEIEFSPVLWTERERLLLVTGNPAAAARFFNFMINLFIKHVLCPDQEQPGAYGNVSSYYGAVEQQGRLTLHLHLIAWIRSSLSPQEIRD